MSRLLFLLLLLLALPAFQARAETLDAPAFFDSARQQIAELRKQLAAPDLDNARLDALRGQNADLATQAQALIAERTPLLAALDARAAELGPAPQGNAKEAPEIAVQRRDIERQRTTLDADIKRAKLVLVDSDDIGDRIKQARRNNFQAHLSQRTASPLTPTFWREINANADRDRAAFATLGVQLQAALARAFDAEHRLHTWGGIALGLLVLLGMPWLARRTLMRWIARLMPQGRLRRSLRAFVVAAGATLCGWFGVSLLLSGMESGGDGTLHDLLQAIVRAVFWGCFSLGVGGGLLAARLPSWRLPPIDDDVALRLRPLPWALGAAITCGSLLHHFYSLADSGLSLTIVGSLGMAIVYALIVGWGLARAARRVATPTQAVRPAWVGAAIALAWIGVLATLCSALLGYIALAYQIAQQLVGAIMVTALLYLLVHFIEDACAAAVHSRAGWLQRTLGVSQQAFDQSAVLGSGALRASAIVLGLLAVLAPLGADPSELVAQIGRYRGQFNIGQFSITPLAIGSAALVLIAGVIAVRGAQRWLRNAYLPTTRIDAAMRNSITTLIGWLGIIVVIALTLSSLGLSLERIAWVASALSVGIGFGLQAIVQNFVSGLILLVERPVKVGDWVVLGDVEGDIRRINVRATEIQLGDRSTAIVPNSELITKSVRNMTLAHAEGRVRFALPLPLGSDAAQVRETVLDVLLSHASVLAHPEPSVLLDGISGGQLVFIASAYIANPRQAASVRSEVLIEALARLRAQGIALSSPLQVAVDAAAGGSIPLRAGERGISAP